MKPTSRLKKALGMPAIQRPEAAPAVKRPELAPAVQRPETADRSVEMSATTSRTSVDIAGAADDKLQREEEEDAKVVAVATTESAPVTMSVEAPPPDQLGRRERVISKAIVSQGFFITKCYIINRCK